MPGLKIHTSNRLENLAGQLAALLAEPLAAPLAREIIVVQSSGMARWISLQLAAGTGICMNCDFAFPRDFVDRTLRTFVPDLAVPQEFSTDAMAWKIFALLPGLAAKKAFAPVKQYLADRDSMRTFRLAEKIAQLFDQYLVYRPEMLMEWERGGDGGWQAALWRQLVAGKKTLHPAAAFASLDGLMALPPPHGTLPERVSLFGISSLPPSYLRIFFALAKHCDVNLFSLNPSQEYFGHDLTPKRKSKILNRSAAAGVKISDDALPTGNPLLASLGKLNRDFVESLLELDERAGFLAQELPEQFVEPNRNDMLASLQRDILHAIPRGTDGHPKLAIAPDDRSVQVHSCHSPMREVEVLHDQLLALFENDQSLRPRDIIVMMPDIERYAPFIEAVFRFPENERQRIPFSVTDRRPRAESGIIETFLALLALPGGRCTATEIFSLLDRPPLRRRFGFDDGAMDVIRSWIAESGIRWGIDAQHRTQLGLPELGANTWRDGLRRLLLGLAMPGRNRAMFGGVMPCDEVEGEGAELLGRFITAAESLFDLAENLPRDRTLLAWADAFAKILADYFTSENPDDARDVRFVQAAADRLRSIATASGSREKIEFRAMRHYFSGLLDDTEQRGGFLAGGVTFCALKPMRSIPARVICLLGMGDKNFPRQAAAQAFDLVSAKPKCGDRSPRDDDRYSFLEAVISARERLFISFTGHSVIDNAAVPPSVLVSDLLDCLDRSFDFPAGKKAGGFLLTEHRLHAFSPLYFDESNPRMFSYSSANAAAAKSLRNPKKNVPDFFTAKLPESDENIVTLRELADFFCAPQKYFVTQMLHMRLDESEDVLLDEEPFDFGNLDRYKIKQELVASALEQAPADFREFAARGLLPLGGLGEASLSALQSDAETFREKVEPELRGHPPEKLAVDFRIGKILLSGIVGPIYGGRLVQFRCAKIKPKDRLRAWIHHLAKCAAENASASETLLVAEDETVCFAPEKNAAGLLAKLLEIYRCGLSEPLPFFPASAFAYAQAAGSPMEKAANKWNGSDRAKGERDDPYCAFCFAGKDPLDEKFAALATEIFGPMLANESERS